MITQAKLIKKISNLKFARLVSGYTQLRDEQTFLLHDIEGLVNKKVFLDPNISGPNNIFIRTNYLTNSLERMQAYEEAVSKVVDREIQVYSRFFDAVDKANSGDGLLSADLIVHKQDAWKIIFDMLRCAKARAPHLGFSDWPGSLDNRGEPSDTFIMFQEPQAQPALLLSFAKLTAALLIKSQKSLKIRQSTHYDQEPTNAMILSAKLQMRKELSQAGFAVSPTEDQFTAVVYEPIGRAVGGGAASVSTRINDLMNKLNR
jgi:hypothetical protein